MNVREISSPQNPAGERVKNWHFPGVSPKLGLRRCGVRVDLFPRGLIDL
ncbi:hypothetical protein [Beijerinckia mobilis]|nr:hypothetical protein [Beijerinckia mobilis]